MSSGNSHDERSAASGPDPGSFGGHPYTPEERSLGYGTEHDPRFVDGVRRAQRIARDWNYRYGSLDRPPYPDSFLTLEEEQTLIRAIDSLFARLDRAERGRAKREGQAQGCMRYEYGVRYTGDPADWRPHRDGLTEDEARLWIAEIEAEGYPKGKFVIVRREIGAWERV